MEITRLRLENSKALKREDELKNKIIQLEVELKAKNLQASNINRLLSSLLTQNQIDKLWSPPARQQTWSEDDIAKSITFYSTSSKLYKILKKQNFPIPSEQILQCWIKKIQLPPGILMPAVRLLKAANGFNDSLKICVLSFDKMQLKKIYSYNDTTDTTIANNDYVQVVMLRGLVSEWQQPVFYSYDNKITPTILKAILKTIESCGYYVVAMINGIDGPDSTLYEQLGIIWTNPWFTYEKHKIYVFPDVPSLLKDLTDNFFEHGYIINGKEVKKNIVSKLLSCTSADRTTSNNTNNENSDNSVVDNKKAKEDAKHFIQSIAKVMGTAAKLGLLDEQNCEECCDMFKLTSTWFNIMNSSEPESSDTQSSVPPYGIAPAIENHLLEKMSKFITDVRVIGKDHKLSFQKGILQCCIAIKLLFKDLQKRFGLKYLVSSRLNNDKLENIFDILGTNGGQNSLPDRKEFRLRLTAYVLGRSKSSTASEFKNEDPKNNLDSSIPLTAEILKCIDWPIDHNIELDKPKVEVEDDFKTLDVVDLENVGNYILQKISGKLKPKEFSLLVKEIREDNLIKPSQTMINYMTELDGIFKTFNESELSICSDYQKKLLNLAKDVKCHPDMKATFFRARMFWRINTLNRKLVTPNLKKRKYHEISN